MHDKCLCIYIICLSIHEDPHIYYVHKEFLSLATCKIPKKIKKKTQRRYKPKNCKWVFVTTLSQK